MTPSGKGYWVFTSMGRVFAFGDASTLRRSQQQELNGPIVASVATPTGQGYYMVGSDGGVFAFGDARYLGSTGGQRLNQPVVAIVPTPSGKGYWLAAADGGIFTFGDARFRGSMGGRHLNAPMSRDGPLRQRLPDGRERRRHLQLLRSPLRRIARRTGALPAPIVSVGRSPFARVDYRHALIKYLGSKRRLVPVLGEICARPRARARALDLFTGHDACRAGVQAARRARHRRRHRALRRGVRAVLRRARRRRGRPRRDRGARSRDLDGRPDVDGYVTETFCVQSRFFQPHNGRRIDAIRDAIDATTATRGCIPSC